MDPDSLPGKVLQRAKEFVRGLPNFYIEHSNMASYREEFESLGLKESHIWEFYKVFRKIDKDNSTTITIEELLVYLAVQGTPYTRRIFSIFDEDGNNNIDFREFVITLWNYCTMAHNALIMFSFDLYDADSSGVIDVREIKLMLAEIYGDAFEENPLAQKILEKINQLDEANGPDDSEISLDAFKEFVRNHPTLLWPAFVMQEHLRQMVCGRRFWKKTSSHRWRMAGGADLQIDQLLLAHMDPEKFRELVERLTGQSMEAAMQKEEASGLNSALKIIGLTGILKKRRDNATGKSAQKLLGQSGKPTTDEQILKIFEEEELKPIYRRLESKGGAAYLDKAETQLHPAPPVGHRPDGAAPPARRRRPEPGAAPAPAPGTVAKGGAGAALAAAKLLRRKRSNSRISPTNRRRRAHSSMTVESFVEEADAYLPDQSKKKKEHPSKSPHSPKKSSTNEEKQEQPGSKPKLAISPKGYGTHPTREEVKMFKEAEAATATAEGGGAPPLPPKHAPPTKAPADSVHAPALHQLERNKASYKRRDKLYMSSSQSMPLERGAVRGVAAHAQQREHHPSRARPPRKGGARNSVQNILRPPQRQEGGPGARIQPGGGAGKAAQMRDNYHHPSKARAESS